MSGHKIFVVGKVDFESRGASEPLFPFWRGGWQQRQMIFSNQFYNASNKIPKFIIRTVFCYPIYLCTWNVKPSIHALTTHLTHWFTSSCSTRVPSQRHQISIPWLQIRLPSWQIVQRWIWQTEGVFHKLSRCECQPLCNTSYIGELVGSEKEYIHSNNHQAQSKSKPFTAFGLPLLIIKARPSPFCPDNHRIARCAQSRIGLL